MPEDFVASLGPPFIAHRLRRLSDSFVESCGEWLGSLGVRAPPRSISTLRLLATQAPLSVTEIAASLRLSHPFIIRTLRDLERLELVEIGRDDKDRRRRLVSLTRQGRSEVELLEQAAAPMATAYLSLFADAAVDLPAVLALLEEANANRSLAKRLAATAFTPRLENAP